ncbi:50S ribosomal protein L23 [bacterium HR15]|uniref:50S ribosomal protein L23 n=1 Tax=uncultured prokaryote TaxID=198431 RepID=H5SJY3_9ZZZZ|nr:50S ribosomal protein L23 [uncultured prokaryote]GBC93307.1 50S ribosomal protein L23 [bacterium HR15]
MKHPTEVIIRPLLTEKGTRLRTELNQYLFEVAADATKIDIANAIKSLYGVEVLKVRTMWVKPKPRRIGLRGVGHTRRWKKAIVTVKPGQTIEDFVV